jgi:hypothetical protein
MTVGELRDVLWCLPGDAEVLAFEPGCEEYCEREVEAEWHGGRVYLHLGAQRDEPRQ